MVVASLSIKCVDELRLSDAAAQSVLHVFKHKDYFSYLNMTVIVIPLHTDSRTSNHYKNKVIN